MCLNSDNLKSPAGSALLVRLHPQQTQSQQDESQLRDSSIGNQSVGDIRQLENGIDILGVINMIQIFTLFEHLAECCDLPAASRCSKTLNWESMKLFIVHPNTSSELRDNYFFMLKDYIHRSLTTLLPPFPLHIAIVNSQPLYCSMTR